MGFGQFLRVELDQLRGVFVVDEDAALAVGCGEFRLATQGQRANDRAIGGVDGGGVFAAAVEGEDAFGYGIVGDRVGIGVGLYRANGFHRLEIEDGRGVGAAAADETASEVGGYRDAVDAGRVRDVAFNRVSVRVHDHDVSAVRDVDAAGVAVHRHVVPAVVAGDGDRFDDVITGGSRGRCRGGLGVHCECERGGYCEQNVSFAHGVFSF